MVDATPSHVRRRDLACLGRARLRLSRWRGPPAALHFAPSAAAPQSGELPPRTHDFMASTISRAVKGPLVVSWSAWTLEEPQAGTMLTARLGVRNDGSAAW